MKNHFAPQFFLALLLSLLAREVAAQVSTSLQINCPPNRTNWVCGVSSFAVVTYPPPTTTSNCPTNASVTCTPASGSVFTLGPTTVICRATNSCRQSATCRFTVTVARDAIPPVIQCPTNFTFFTCSPTGAAVNFPAPTATDNLDATPTIVCSPPSGSVFPLGTSTVTCAATDDCTNRSTCTITVTVRPSLLYNGLCHSPLGLAALNVNTNDELEVSGPGTNGEDGVRIDISGSDGLRWWMKNSPSQPDGDMEVRVSGLTTAGMEVTVSRMFFEFRNGRRAIRPAAASYELKLLRRGEVVFQQAGRTGSVDIPPCAPVEQEHCVGKPFAGLNPNLPYCINFLTIECDWDTPSGPVQADALVVTPEDPLPAGLDAIGFLVAVTPRKAVVAPLTLHSERLLMFGNRDQPSRPHRALGQARLVAEQGMLTMANLGSSGQDGVRIDLEGSRGLQWRMKNPPGTPEGDMDVEVFGRTTAGTEILLRRISHQYRSGRQSVTPGAGPYEMKLLRQGQVVFQQGGRTGAVEIPPCQHVENEHCVGEPFAGWSPHLPYCISYLTVECDWETQDGPVRADTLVLTPEDPLPPIAAISAVQILGRNVRDLPSLTLLAERVLTSGGGAFRLACPPDITVRTCSTNRVPVTFPLPNVTGGTCSALPFVACVPPSGSLFPPGTTTVQCTATNICGERAVCVFTVTVIDTLVYQSEGEPNNALGSAKDLGLASFVAVAGRISPAGDVDYYRFTAVPNSKAWITIDTGGAAWAGANSRDSVLTLYNGAGVAIESDDNDGSGNGADSVLESGDASALAGSALAGGTYYVSVAANAGGIIAPYRLYLTVTTNVIPAEVEPNNTAATATALVPAGQDQGVRNASLNPFGDEDWYTVTIPGPSLLHISVDGDPERDGIGTDVVVDLFRQNGVMILFSANSSAAGGAVAEGFVYRLSIPGTYYVRVRGATTSVTGSYRVMVAHCPLPPTAGLGIVHRGGRVTLSWPAAHEPGLLRSSHDLRTWTFLDLTPTAVGDELRVELPSTPPHQFFQLIPAGGWSNDTYHCCDVNGQNCVPQQGPSTFDPHVPCGPGKTLVHCYETENSSVCE